MTSRPIPAEDYAASFREFQHTAFRLEFQEHPLTFEQDAFAQFLAGSPPQPSEWADWQGWLDQVMVLTAHGRKVSRISIISDPPTSYQQWRISGASWHRNAGEETLYLPRKEADELGIKPVNWWLFDDEQAVIVKFTAAGGVGETTLVTGPEVSIYCRWRDLAMSHASDGGDHHRLL